MKFLIAPLLSFMFPSLGQFYNRQYKRGALLLFLLLLFMVFPSLIIAFKVKASVPIETLSAMTPQSLQSLMLEQIQKSKHYLSMFTFAVLGVWAYSISQAYFKAKEICSTHEKEPDNN